MVASYQVVAFLTRVLADRLKSVESVASLTLIAL